jgi:hypothetical protein
MSTTDDAALTAESRINCFNYIYCILQIYYVFRPFWCFIRTNCEFIFFFFSPFQASTRPAFQAYCQRLFKCQTFWKMFAPPRWRIVLHQKVAPTAVCILVIHMYVATFNHTCRVAERIIDDASDPLASPRRSVGGHHNARSSIYQDLEYYYLCTLFKQNVDFKQKCFTTMAAIRCVCSMLARLLQWMHVFLSEKTHSGATQGTHSSLQQ